MEIRASHFPCGSVDWNWLGITDLRHRIMSLPLRKCGLKLRIKGLDLPKVGHFPCGSVDWNCFKRRIWYEPSCHFPCGSVDWNCIKRRIWYEPSCHFPCGSVDWNLADPVQHHGHRRHFPCGSVDWNIGKRIACLVDFCHFPCGSVDWNFYHRWYRSGQWVTSLAEVWIETSLCCISLCNHPVTSLAEVWIETKVDWEVQNEITSHFPCGSVDWNII